MIGETKVDVSKTLHLHPLDALICENCGREVAVAADADNQVTCPRCSVLMDKSHFIKMSRSQTVWVPKNGFGSYLQQTLKLPRFNCVEHYRGAVQFRRAMFSVYEEQGRITDAQALGLLVAFQAASEKGILKLLGRDDGALASRSSFQRASPFDAEMPRKPPWLWNWLGATKLKLSPGRPTRTDMPVLILDAVVLMFCPNAYSHFLQDALKLRVREYEAKGNYASAHHEQWVKFWEAKRAVEVSCKRIWRLIFSQNPAPPSGDWWERVARQQGLMG